MRQRRAPPKRSVLRVIELGKRVDRVSIYTIPIWDSNLYDFYASSGKAKKKWKNVRGINAWVRNKKFISGYILIMIITYDR